MALAHSRRDMRILLTNDDGINARGLDLLETIARRFSDDIWVVAPTDEQSGAGHSLTLTQPVRIRRHDKFRFSVTGTPTDAVMMALAQRRTKEVTRARQWLRVYLAAG